MRYIIWKYSAHTFILSQSDWYVSGLNGQTLHTAVKGFPYLEFCVPYRLGFSKISVQGIDYTCIQFLTITSLLPGEIMHSGTGISSYFDYQQN